jgi:hypothetical protein
VGAAAAAAAGFVAGEGLCAVCAGSNTLRVLAQVSECDDCITPGVDGMCVCVQPCACLHAGTRKQALLQMCADCCWCCLCRLHADRQASLGVCGDGVCCGVCGGVFLYWRGLRYGREPCGGAA